MFRATGHPTPPNSAPAPPTTSSPGTSASSPPTPSSSAPSWLADQVDDSRATGTVDIDGLTWSVYDYRDEAERGNLEYALSTEVDGTIFLVYGTAESDDAQTLAAAVTRSAEDAS